MPIQFGSHWDDTCRIDSFMAAIIVFLDVVEVDCFCNSWHIVNAFGVIPEVWIVSQMSDIAFEMAIINTVKTNKSCEKRISASVK